MPISISFKSNDNELELKLSGETPEEQMEAIRRGIKILKTIHDPDPILTIGEGMDFREFNKFSQLR